MKKEGSSTDIDSTNKQTTMSKQNQAVDVYEDLLPSFQMHTFMFNRSLAGSTSNEDLPPEYEEMISTSENASSNFISDITSSAETDTPTFTDPENLVLNNLNKLQRINLPFKANITLTNDYVYHGSEYTTISPLKEYLPGEMVYGFVVFENKSTIKIPFEILLVSMECEIAIKNPNTGQLHTKNILKMYDLEASYNFAGIETCCQDHQRYNPKDDTYTGFEKRLLEPGIKIKKCFKFKIPEYVLDSSCEQQLFDHLKSPPSFGINKRALGGKTSMIKINPPLGYGRIEEKGSPIHVSDHALTDSYCNYYINVQIIGKNMDIYKPFYRENTLHQYDYIFIKNQEFYFRVGKSSLLPYDNKSPHGSTNAQLELFKHTAIDTLEVLQERGMLSKTGITSIAAQDEIIYSSNGKRKTVYTVDDIQNEKKLALSSEYTNNTMIELKKGLFSGIEGKLEAEFIFDKFSAFKSYLPKVMENMKEDSVYKGGITDRYRPVVRINLSFKGNSVNDKLPKSVTISPKLLKSEFYSTKHLPFTIDNDYLQNSATTIRKQLKEFGVYYNTIVEQSKKERTPVLRETKDALQSLASCKYWESDFRHIIKVQEVSLENKWELDVNDAGIYKCSIEVPMIVDLNYLERCPHALLPSFQSCLIARLYKLGLSIACGKVKSEHVTLPVTVL